MVDPNTNSGLKGNFPYAQSAFISIFINNFNTNAQTESKISTF